MLILSILIVFLSGLDLAAGQKDDPPSLGMWAIDKYCDSHQSTLLRKAYNDVRVMAKKALEDVRFVQQPRPSHIQDRIEWDRIARAFENMFGFKPEEKGTGTEDEYFKKVSGKPYIAPPLPSLPHSRGKFYMPRLMLDRCL